MRMAARAGLLLLLVLAAGAAVHAHDGPPYPIVSDRVSGPYVVSIWTDPDSTDDGTPVGPPGVGPGPPLWVHAAATVTSATAANAQARLNMTRSPED